MIDCPQVLAVIRRRLPHVCTPLYDEAIQIARDHGVALCPVLLTSHWERDPNAKVYLRSGWELERAQSVGRYLELASATGGLKFDAISNQDVLPGILKSLATHIRYDYVAGFSPSTSGGRKKHKVEIVLRNGKMGEVSGGVRTVVH